MSLHSQKRIRVVFATHAFEDARTGPAVYARYLWEAFRDDPHIEFHLVSPDGPVNHPKSHLIVPRGPGSRHFYAAISETCSELVSKLGGKGILHLNAPHYALVSPPPGWLLWLQLNDYDGAQLLEQAFETLRSAGIRRFMSLSLRRYIERRMLRRCNLALANSDFTKRTILAAYPEIPPSRLQILYKAVDLSFFTGVRTHQNNSETRRFVFLGSNFIRKRLHLAIEAFNLLRNNSSSLRIAGCTKKEFVSSYPKLELEASHPNINFLGKLDRKDIRELLLNSDVLLLPSHQEALGIVSLEAIACGCRVIASRTGGIPEIVDSPEVGCLVDESTPNAWMMAMKAEIKKVAPMGNHRALLLERFSSLHMLRRLKNLYLNINS